jgi:hypothetical protein
MRFSTLLLPLLGGCSFVSSPQAHAHLLTDADMGIWSASPPATRMTIELVRGDNSRELVTDLPPPSADNPVVEIGDPGDVDFGTVAHFEATGFGANGENVFRGSTVPLYLNGIGGLELPFFVGRARAWSRPPTPLGSSHVHPLLSFMHGYLVVSAGDSAATADPTQVDMYDLGVVARVVQQPALPRAPKSIVVVGTAALLIDDNGATWVDLYSRDKSEAVAPGGGFSFAQVAGGDVVNDVLNGGDQYVVGATRASGPTSWILRVDSATHLSALSLTTPRVGASAGLVRNTLYVSGGTVDGSTTGGNVESCVSPATTMQCLPVQSADMSGMPSGQVIYPPDPIANHAVVEGVLPSALANPDMPAPPPNADGSVVTSPVGFLVGGTNPVTGDAGGIRTFNLDCPTNTCDITTRATLPALTRTRAFFLGPSAARQLLIVGETSDGQDHAYLADPLANPIAATEIALRQPRKGASVSLFPNGLVGVVGGTDAASNAAIASFELFALP